MGCLGVHFALTAGEIAQLRSFVSDPERLEYLQGYIEPAYFERCPDMKAESDKSWDALHRGLADGKLSWDGGEYPLNHTVLGGELLYTGSDYIMSLKTPQMVRDIAEAVLGITETDFQRRYLAIDRESYCHPLSEEDCRYTWDWFQGIRDLYRRAAEDGRFVLFTADQ